MTANRPQPRPGVLDIDPYVPGKSSAPGATKVFKLSSNETPLGPSANAIAAYRAAGDHLEDYPDGSASALRDAIGASFGLDPDRIVCGAGSDDLLNLLARAFLKDGDEAIYTTHGFLVYPIATMGTGAKAIAVSEKHFTANVVAILKAVTPKTKVVFLANPNNPTGTYVPFDEVKRLRAGLPPHVLLVLDATIGQNGLAQARVFADVVDITGVALTKLDGTARGGILVAIADKFGLPVHFIGVGEGVDDLAPFTARDFARAVVGLES